jgi:dolichyl-phosphate-mannose-protein mannosyltransferase
LARRTFGKGAGGAAAAFAALSGPHVAFSRMALTDSSFLLFWVLALGQGQRFLERPNPARAVLLGFAVGAAQLFKYNGWISGVIVGLTAALWLLLHPEGRRSRLTIATWGWGFGAAVVAAATYWPWFQFVESHGGYAALLAHQRSYLGGISSWPGHLSLQLTQATALSGGPPWLAASGFAAACAVSVTGGDFRIERRLLPRILVGAASLTALYLIPAFAWSVVLGWIFLCLIRNSRGATSSVCLLGVGWVLLAVMTPFYHPYARLWLPIHACGWLISGGVFVWIRSRIEVWGRGRPIGWNRSNFDPLPWFASLCTLTSAFLAFSPADSPWKGRSIHLLDPTDSLKDGCRSILSELPNDVKNLRVFARPPVRFYLGLAGQVTVSPQPDLDRLLVPGPPTCWALLDMAMIRQDRVAAQKLERSQTDWVVAGESPTILNLPTLLDVDPSAARREPIDAEAALWLLRPKLTGDSR